jgi:hypothetical protein
MSRRRKKNMPLSRITNHASKKEKELPPPQSGK